MGRKPHVNMTMFDRGVLDHHIEEILRASSAERTFEAARAIGELGTDALPGLERALAIEAPRLGEAAYWGLASAIHWVLSAYIQSVGHRRRPLSEAVVVESVEALGTALKSMGEDLESAAIKIGSVLGEEIPEAIADNLRDDALLEFGARLLDRCRLNLETALATDRPTCVIGATLGLVRLASHVGADLVLPALQRARVNARSPKAEEVARWGIDTLTAGDVAW